jgi:hypothetical protein
VSASGHEERFLPPKWSGRRRFRERSAVVDDWVHVGLWVRLLKAEMRKLRAKGVVACTSPRLSAIVLRAGLKSNTSKT